MSSYQNAEGCRTVLSLLCLPLPAVAACRGKSSRRWPTYLALRESSGTSGCG